MQRWHVDSDAHLDPQAWVLRPDVVLDISQRIIAAEEPLEGTLAAMDSALASIRRASEDGQLMLPAIERRWMDLQSAQLEAVLRDAEALLVQVRDRYPANVFSTDE